MLDPRTGTLVESGANIPLDQTLAGPRRAKVEFETGSDARGLGAMLAGLDMEGHAATPLARPGRRKGWGPHRARRCGSLPDGYERCEG